MFWSNMRPSALTFRDMHLPEWGRNLSYTLFRRGDDIYLTVQTRERFCCNYTWQMRFSFVRGQRSVRIEILQICFFYREYTGVVFAHFLVEIFFNKTINDFLETRKCSLHTKFQVSITKLWPTKPAPKDRLTDRRTERQTDGRQIEVWQLRDISSLCHCVRLPLHLILSCTDIYTGVLLADIIHHITPSED